jgi:glutaredoxin
VCSIFQNLGCEVDERDVAMSEQLRNELRQRLPESATTHALPRVFIGDHYLGGYDEVTELNETGQLLQLLKVSACPHAVPLPPGLQTSVQRLMGRGGCVRRWSDTGAAGQGAGHCGVRRVWQLSLRAVPQLPRQRPHSAPGGRAAHNNQMQLLQREWALALQQMRSSFHELQSECQVKRAPQNS